MLVYFFIVKTEFLIWKVQVGLPRYVIKIRSNIGFRVLLIYLIIFTLNLIYFNFLYSTPLHQVLTRDKIRNEKYGLKFEYKLKT